jgi:hypothetical protein
MVFYLAAAHLFTRVGGLPVGGVSVSRWRTDILMTACAAA